jgi:ABC-type sugar transport system substrate-binding protein
VADRAGIAIGRVAFELPFHIVRRNVGFADDALQTRVSDVMKMTASQAAVGQMVVGYLQTHPDVDCVYAPYDPAAAVTVNAIVQACVQEKVKRVGIVVSAQNIEFIRQGRVEVGDAAFDNF